MTVTPPDTGLSAGAAMIKVVALLASILSAFVPPRVNRVKSSVIVAWGEPNSTDTVPSDLEVELPLPSCRDPLPEMIKLALLMPAGGLSTKVGELLSDGASRT